MRREEKTREEERRGEERKGKERKEKRKEKRMNEFYSGKLLCVRPTRAALGQGGPVKKEGRSSVQMSRLLVAEEQQDEAAVSLL